MFNFMASVAVAVGAMVHGMFGGAGGNGGLMGGPGMPPQDQNNPGQGGPQQTMQENMPQGMPGMSVSTNTEMAGEMNGNTRRRMMTPGIFGTVTAVDGSTLTVQSHVPPMMPRMTMMGSSSQGMPMNMHMPTTTMMAMMMHNATTTFTVDASQAKIIQGMSTTTISVSDIQVGDKVIVQGPISGTDITAKVIIDNPTPNQPPTTTPPFMGQRQAQQEGQQGQPQQPSVEPAQEKPWWARIF